MPSSVTDRLPRSLGLLSAVGLVIGITIGSGIFRTPAVIATRVPDPMLMLSVCSRSLGYSISTKCGRPAVGIESGYACHARGASSTQLRP